MSHKKRIDTFKQHLAQFLKAYGFSMKQSSEDALKLCEGYVEKLDNRKDIDSESYQALLKKLENSLLFSIQQLYLYDHASQFLNIEKVPDYEKKIRQLLQEPGYAEKVLDQLIRKRMPKRKVLEKEVASWNLNQPFVAKDEDDWSTDFAPISSKVVHESPSTLYNVFKPFGYKILISDQNKLRYFKLLDDWRDFFILDKTYHGQSRLDASVHECFNYFYDRFLGFFDQSYGYWDVANLFLAKLDDEVLLLDHRDKHQLRRAIQKNRPGSPKRLSLRQFQGIKQTIQRDGTLEQRTSLHNAYQASLEKFANIERTNTIVVDNKIIAVIPDFVRTHCEPQQKKPHFWQWDKKRQYRLVQTMTDAMVLAPSATTRSQAFLHEITKRDFLPSRTTYLLSETLREAKFLDKQYRALQSGFRQKGWFYKGTRKLGRHYHHEQLQHIQDQLETLTQVFETAFQKFYRWIDNQQQCTLPIETLKRFEQQWLDQAEQFKPYLERQDARITRYHRRLPNHHYDHCVLSVRYIEFIEPITSTWEKVQRVLLAREKKWKEAQTSKKVNILIDQKNAFLNRLSEGRLLSETELTLLCANSKKNHVQLQLDRQTLHHAIDQYWTKTLNRVIQNKGIEEDVRYLEHIARYYHSISYELGLRSCDQQLRKQLSKVDEETSFYNRLTRLLHQIEPLEKWLL